MNIMLHREIGLNNWIGVKPTELTREEVTELITELWTKPENRIPMAEAAGIPVDEFHIDTILFTIREDIKGVTSLREFIEREQ